MAGQGGYKHRQVRLHRKRKQKEQKALENIARVRNQFESKGQTWDPKNDSTQMAALNHDARRFLSQSEYANH